MQKSKTFLLVTFLLFFIAGCERNRNTADNETADGTSTTAANNERIESGVQYKITLNDNTFSPDTIRLSSGICYQLDFENTGNSEAEFIAGKNPSDKGFDNNFFEGMSVENILNDEERTAKADEPLTGMKLKPGEKGSLAFTPDDGKKGEWITAIRTGGKTAEHNGIIIIN